ncbi:pro-sigmaK processing inhibitor BofA family protein [Natronobacterium texcoconense]|uniref:SigmaK-factor processing regulatory protein BofA n=1 Tax=Natronobacterium texcoconense TaxID=1095778 RepID=A0A1H1HM64_NATTX|nr:pro-sigmaK processing inhibitor BofA family protein [Natronobacterium texcoconense]SDR26517.1 SigmaK-factor processing regulatory protein BofA [Natronobacterium texcoconense]
MVTGLEIILLVLVLAAVLGASTIIQTVRPFIVNAVVGLLVLFLAQAVFGLSVAVTPIVLVIVALGGVPGSLLVILLSLFGVAFVP